MITRAIASLLSLLLLAPALVTGCTDLTPIIVTPPDAGAPDTGPRPDSGDVDAGPSACEVCLRTPEASGGCGDEITSCEEDPRCASTFRCALDRGCLALPAQKDKLNCGAPCALAAGITSQTDPVIALIFAVVTCQTSACTVACEGAPDGG